MNKNINKLIENYITDNNYTQILLKEEKNKFLITKLNNLILDEPSKLFKKKHKLWQEEVNKINDELNNNYDNLINQYKELENIINE